MHDYRNVDAPGAYQNLGPDSRSSQCYMKSLQMDTCGPGAADKKYKQQQGLTICGQKASRKDRWDDTE